MAWNTPITWATNQLVTATDLNGQVRDNLNYLFNRPYAQYKRTSGNYTTTSTSFVDVDATNLNLSLTTKSGVVLFFFQGVSQTDTNGAWAIFDVLVDGVAFGGGWLGYGMQAASYRSLAGENYDVTFIGMVAGLSAGSHTFKLRWKVTSGTGILFGDTTNRAAMFGVVEVA